MKPNPIQRLVEFYENAFGERVLWISLVLNGHGQRRRNLGDRSVNLVDPRNEKISKCMGLDATATGSQEVWLNSTTIVKKKTKFHEHGPRAGVGEDGRMFLMLLSDKQVKPNF